MRTRTLCLLIVFFIFSLLISPKELLPAPYYEGKRIKIIVGVAVGGGYDRMARLLARHLPKYIPGNPTFIVENMPGAAGMVANNQIYNLVKPDGLTIGSIGRAMPFPQLAKAEGVKYDMTKFSWIGSAAVESNILAIRAVLPYKTFDELRKAKEPIHFGEIFAGTGNLFSSLARDFIGLNIKIVTYDSTPAVILAIERGEVDGQSGTHSSLKPYITRGLLRPMIRGRVAEPGIESLPVNEDLTTDKKGKTFMAMLSASDLIGRPYVAPPGTPPEVMNILRTAFAKVAQDPELKEEAKKSMLEVQYVPADECLKVLDFLFKQPDDIIKEFTKYAKF